MTNTFWETIKIALWDFQCNTVDLGEFEARDQTPGAREKMDVLTEHIRRVAASWPLDDRDLRCGGETSCRRPW